MSDGGAAETPTRGDLRRAPVSLLSRGSRFKPGVWRVSRSDGPLLLKDCAGSPPWWRPLARWLLAREVRALRRLDGVEGVPRLVGRVDRDAVLLSWVEGQPLGEPGTTADAPALAAALRRIVEAMHQRHVYHLDLRQRRNVLVDPAGRPWVVDFGAAHAPGPVGRLLLAPWLARVDRQAVLKVLARYAPEAMSADEARSFLRGQRWRRLWPFSPYRDRGLEAAVRRRLRDLSADGGADHEM